MFFSSFFLLFFRLDSYWVNQVGTGCLTRFRVATRFWTRFRFRLLFRVIRFLLLRFLSYLNAVLFWLRKPMLLLRVCFERIDHHPAIRNLSFFILRVRFSGIALRRGSGLPLVFLCLPRDSYRPYPELLLLPILKNSCLVQPRSS